jgi:hypothetical protein
MTDIDITIPVTTEAGRLAVYIQHELTALLGNAPSTGGCRTFYSPEEWTERGESYGRESCLIVVHDGGDYASAFNYAYGDSTLMEAMRGALDAAGYYAEACTSWYTAIYPAPRVGNFADKEV